MKRSFAGLRLRCFRVSMFSSWMLTAICFNAEERLGTGERGIFKRLIPGSLYGMMA